VVACQQLDPECTLQQAADAFSAYDKNGSGELGFQEFQVAFTMIKVSKQAASGSVTETRPASPPNKAEGKSFTGGKGGGRYANVKEPNASPPPSPTRSAPKSPSPAGAPGGSLPSQKVATPVPDPAPSGGDRIILDMFEDGRFIYKYNHTQDSEGDGAAEMHLFLEGIFGTEEQMALRGQDVVQRLQTQLKVGGVQNMTQLRGMTKRDLDEIGIPVGPRAAMVEQCKAWKPPNWSDASFVLKGRWSAATSGVTVKVTFTATSEEIAAYDNVEVPSGAVFVLDGAFVASGACRGLNGNTPGVDGMERAFLAFQTDPIEEAEVEWVRGQKKLIKDLLGAKLVEMQQGAEWMLAEYQVQTKPLLKDGGVYVRAESVQNSEEKFQQLSSMVSQTLATFEDYYGSCR